MKRRDILAGAGGLALGSVAGCLGVVGMDEHAASPAGVDPNVRDETGYEQTNVDELVVRESFEAAGISEEITVRNYLTEHEKSIDIGPIGGVQAAAFMILTSPQISIVGRELNPIEEMSSDELIELIEADFDGISSIEPVSEGEVTILDQETTESVFEADAEFEGRAVDVYIHISESVQTADDHLVTIGVYPELVEDIERDNIETLRDNVVENAQ